LKGGELYEKENRFDPDHARTMEGIDEIDKMFKDLSALTKQ